MLGQSITQDLVAQENLTPGSMAMFQVTVDPAGGGTPTYFWTLDGQSIADSPPGKYLGLGTDSLTVTNVQESDEGNYNVLVLVGAMPLFATAVALTVCELVCTNIALLLISAKS